MAKFGSFRAFLGEMGRHWELLQTQLDNIAKEREQLAVAPEKMGGARLVAINRFKQRAKVAIEAFKGELPGIIQKKSDEVELARRNLRAGRPLNWKPQPPPDASEDWRHDYAEKRADAQHKALLDRFDRLIGLQEAQNKHQAFRAMSASDLCDLVRKYSTEAAAPERFPCQEWAADCEPLRAALALAAQAGDTRAAMSLQGLGEIEGAVLRNAGFIAGAADREERDLRDLEFAVDGLATGGLENLADIETTLGPALRSLERADGEMPKAFAGYNVVEIDSDRWNDLEWRSRPDVARKIASGEFVPEVEEPQPAA